MFTCARILFLVSLLFVALFDPFDPYSPFKFLIFVNLHLTSPISNLKHTRKCTQAGKTLNLLGIESWLSIRQAETLTGVPMVFIDVF